METIVQTYMFVPFGVMNKQALRHTKKRLDHNAAVPMTKHAVVLPGNYTCEVHRLL